LFFYQEKLLKEKMNFFNIILAAIATATCVGAFSTSFYVNLWAVENQKYRTLEHAYKMAKSRKRSGMAKIRRQNHPKILDTNATKLFFKLLVQNIK